MLINLIGSDVIFCYNVTKLGAQQKKLILNRINNHQILFSFFVTDSRDIFSFPGNDVKSKVVIDQDHDNLTTVSISLWAQSEQNGTSTDLTVFSYTVRNADGEIIRLRIAKKGVSFC